MVRPARFCANPETMASNRFQRSGHDVQSAQCAAEREFDDYVRVIRGSGVQVQVFHDTPADQTPDSLFPNNWISLLHDGTIVTYPMEALNRRRERKPAMIRRLMDDFRVGDVIDFSYLEQEEKYLEGTGAMVFDHENRVVYACLSSRCHPEAIEKVAARLGYARVLFEAFDRDGHPIYHTNVMMSVGRTLAIVCLEAIVDARQRSEVIASLEGDGKTLLAISHSQMEHFAGNVLELAGRDDQPVLAMSTRAWSAFDPHQQARLAAYAAIAKSPLDTIEELGGGGARCMIAENFLPAA
jgi:hypothetical protein